MIWAIIISIIGILAYLLWMPVEFCLNSYQDRYYLRFGVLGLASIERDASELVRIHLKVLSMNFYWKPSDLKFFGTPGKTGKPKRKKGKADALRRLNWCGIIRSFRIKVFRLELDTGDILLNARLYPVGALYNHPPGNIQINFQNRNHIDLKVFNRPVYALKAIINH